MPFDHQQEDGGWWWWCRDSVVTCHYFNHQPPPHHTSTLLLGHYSDGIKHNLQFEARVDYRREDQMFWAEYLTYCLVFWGQYLTLYRVFWGEYLTIRYLVSDSERRGPGPRDTLRAGSIGIQLHGNTREYTVFWYLCSHPLLGRWKYIRWPRWLKAVGNSK